MLVSVILEWACPCGTTAKGVTVKTVRINKKSLRTAGQGIGFMPRTCSECGEPLPGTLAAAPRLADSDLERVNAYRQRKGWPQITAEVAP